jgi:signal transduction histidine kinase
MASRWSQVQPFADWTLAAAIAALAAAFALTDSSPLRIGGPTAIAGPVAVVAVSYALAGAALGLRRRAPFAVLAAVTVVLALPFLAFGSSEGFGSLAAVFIALYTVGSRAKVATAVAALVLYTVFWVVLALRDPLNPDLHSALWSWPVYLLGVMLLLVGAFLRTRRLYVAELRARAEGAEADREERIRAATADERARIARELHDAVAHAMSVMVMQAEAADELLDRDPARARIAIERVQRVGREGLGEMRRLLGVLRRDESPALAPQPGVSSLQALADEVSATGLPVRLTVEGEPAALTAGVDISAYRIVQEALTNALKHAGASGVEVLLRYGESLELEISDDGDGPSPPGENGHGLIGMRERVALYGGSFDAGRSPSGGFHVHATLPIDGAS